MAEGNGKAIQKSDRADIQVDSKTTARVVESLVLRGDISALNSEERSRFYVQICRSLGLAPAALPFAILRLNGKEILYPTRSATDQLAAIHRLNREIVDGPRVIDMAGTKLVYAVCRATHPNGRIETAVATVPLSDPLNAMMKAETKAKRRATLSILGLGMLDETEVETIPDHVKSPGPAVNVTIDAKPTELSPFLATFQRHINEIEMPGEAVGAWIRHRSELASLTDAERQHAWEALCTRVEYVGKMKNAKVWLRRAIAEEDARAQAPESDEGSDNMIHFAGAEYVDESAALAASSDVPQAVIDDVAQHESPLPLAAAAAIWWDLNLGGPDWPIEARTAAFKYLARSARQKSAELQRAIAFERWGRGVREARDESALRKVYANAKIEIKSSPWGKETGSKALEELERLCAERKAKLTPPDPPNGGGAPKPPAPVASEDDPERAAIAAEGHIETSEFAQTKAVPSKAQAAVAEWRAHASEKRDKFELANSFLKRESGFKKLGIADECLAIAADLLLAMLGTDSRSHAIGFIRNQGRKKAA